MISQSAEKLIECGLDKKCALIGKGSEKPLSKAILDQNNTKVGELQEKSERLYYKKEYAKAVELLDEAIGIEQTGREDKETLGDLWKQKAECCRELEKYQDEVEAYSQAIECNPKDAFLYYQRSSIYYYYLKDINNAREDVKKSLQMEPNRSYAKQLLERIESELGN